MSRINGPGALACEPPQDSGRPITHWTHRELAEELQAQGIVESISASQVGRLLKKRFQPHRSSYWLNAKADEHKAERIAEDLPMGRKKPLAREFEYKRHGTQTLIAGLNVASGAVEGICGDTRTESDFVTAIKHFIAVHPGRPVYHFVADQLNTHKSEASVRSRILIVFRTNFDWPLTTLCGRNGLPREVYGFHHARLQVVAHRDQLSPPWDDHGLALVTVP